MSDHKDTNAAAFPPPHPADNAAPPYPGEVALPPCPAGDPAPPCPAGNASPPYPGEVTPPPYPAEYALPPCPAGDPAPPCPAGSASPPCPGEVAPPPYPAEYALPPCPGEEIPSTRAAEATPSTYSAGEPAPPSPGDDLALEEGRRMVKAVQRRIDGAALAHLVVTVPIALISMVVVTLVFAQTVPFVGPLIPLAWLLSGPLVFNRDVESALARRLLGLRRPTPQEARRLHTVWEQVIRRAGVDRGTYELWVQEHTGLNATAVAGHLVAVSRHAMERLPNSRLAAVLAHELGHHVGGHTWAAMLADWYALPARAAGRAVLALVRRARPGVRVACGGCLSLMILPSVALYTLMDASWLVLPLAVAASPLLIAWLHRRAEFRADAYAVGLGFGEALEDVLVKEAQSAAVPGAPPYVPTPGGSQVMSRTAHTNTEARLRNVRLVMSQQTQRSAR